MNVKKELTIGLFFSTVVIVLTIFYIFQFQNQKKILPLPIPSSSNSNSQVNQQTSLTLSEINKHNSANDCWIIIQSNVYNVTNYLNQHPGGSERIIPFCGQDASQAFLTKDGRGSHSQKAFQILDSFKLGAVNSK